MRDEGQGGRVHGAPEMEALTIQTLLVHFACALRTHFACALRACMIPPPKGILLFWLHGTLSCKLPQS